VVADLSSTPVDRGVRHPYHNGPSTETGQKHGNGNSRQDDRMNRMTPNHLDPGHPVILSAVVFCCCSAFGTPASRNEPGNRANSRLGSFHNADTASATTDRWAGLTPNISILFILPILSVVVFCCWLGVGYSAAYPV